jgi:hypothetical protein
MKAESAFTLGWNPHPWTRFVRGYKEGGYEITEWEVRTEDESWIRGQVNYMGSRASDDPEYRIIVVGKLIEPPWWQHWVILIGGASLLLGGMILVAVLAEVIQGQP